MEKLNVDGTEIQVLQIEEDDYISLNFKRLNLVSFHFVVL